MCRSYPSALSHPGKRVNALVDGENLNDRNSPNYLAKSGKALLSPIRAYHSSLRSRGTDERWERQPIDHNQVAPGLPSHLAERNRYHQGTPPRACALLCPPRHLLTPASLAQTLAFSFCSGPTHLRRLCPLALHASLFFTGSEEEKLAADCLSRLPSATEHPRLESRLPAG